MVRKSASPLDAAALRMPGRAIGLRWFDIDKKTRTLQASLSPPALVRPNTTLKLPVKLGGLNSGEDAKVVVAAVDVGILKQPWQCRREPGRAPVSVVLLASAARQAQHHHE